MKVWTFYGGFAIKILGYIFSIRNIKKAKLMISERLIKDKKIDMRGQWIIGKFIIKKVKYIPEL